MAKAFKCDNCKEYIDGTAKTRISRSVTKENTNWLVYIDGDNTICDPCFNRMLSVIKGAEQTSKEVRFRVALESIKETVRFTNNAGINALRARILDMINATFADSLDDTL